MRTQLPLCFIDDNVCHDFIYAAGQQHSDEHSHHGGSTAIPSAPSSSHRLARASSSASDSASDVMADWSYLDPLPPNAQIEIPASAREYRRLRREKAAMALKEFSENVDFYHARYTAAEAARIALHPGKLNCFVKYLS